MPPKPEIDTLLNKLKVAITGTKTAKIDAALDKAVRDISSYKSHSGRNGYIDVVKSMISRHANVNIGGSTGGLFSQGVTPTAFGQGSRLMRYRTYEAIVSQINYCHRALQVLVDNILSPDDITKVSLEVKPKTYLEDETPIESKAKHVRQVIREMKIEERLPYIIRNTLMYGDFFAELGDAKTALTSRSIIAEAALYENQFTHYVETGQKEVLRVQGPKDQHYEIVMDYSGLVGSENGNGVHLGEAEDDNDDDNKKGKNKKVKKGKINIKSLKNLKMIFHSPQYILKLQSAMFPISFGYLVFPQVAVAPNTQLQDEAVNNICLSILKSVEKKVPQIKEFKNRKELEEIIKAMISQFEYNKAIEIRYIPPDRMVHFMVPTSKYYPYGESIFDSTQYSSKVIIALETALAIQRLSRSTEKRKIAVEIGLPRDARKAVEALKEEFRKRKISLDSFGTVDTIPSMITTFEDIYIPQKDGKAFVDVSTFTEGNIDVRGKVDELKFMRDQLVSSLGVPPAFIGIEENLSNKAALSEENILFARTVIGHQKYLTHQIRDLVEKIYQIIDPEEALTILDNVDISLPTPRSLQYERESRYMSELANLVESLERIGIPKEYSKKKYLSQIDWEDVKKYEMDEKIEKTLDPDKAKEDEMGGFGGAPGGF
jgi:hypothetical protein